MATGGIFQLITNDGKQDRMLMATALLNKRLRLIEQARAADPLISDSTPTLLDIEKTHILFMNAHFKPFASIGYEYNKQRPQSGVSLLGSEVTFSIPQFGDFFHDMVLRLKLNAPTIERQDEMVLDDNVDTNDNDLGRQNCPAFRWASFPGERIMERVSFQVNGNPLDEYTYHSMNFFREFIVTSNKKAGWFRCVGQETRQPGWWRQPGTDLVLNANPGNETGTPWAGVGPQSYRICADVKTGPQTPKLNPDDLELFIPLLFWFNLDPRLAIPSVAIPYGQRFINIRFSPANLMYGLVPRGSGTWNDPRATLTAASNEISEIELYINNIFVNPEVHDIFIRRIGFSLIRVHRQQLITADKASDEILLNNMKWPLETLFVGMRVADQADGSPWNLDRWMRFADWQNQEYVTCALGCDTTTTVFAKEVDSGDNPGFTGLANANANVPDEAWNVPVGNVNDPEPQQLAIRLVSQPFGVPPDGPGNDWANFGFEIGQCLFIGGCLFKLQQINPDGNTMPDVALFHPPINNLTQAGEGNSEIQAGDLLDNAHICTVNKCVVEAPTCVRTVDFLSIRAHGIPLYNRFEGTFFDSYIPYQYGGSNIQTPTFCGPMMVTFNFYPKSYQPSGHINVSRAREFYILYESSVISSTNLGQLVVIASALNFLLISDGSAVKHV